MAAIALLGTTSRCREPEPRVPEAVLQMPMELQVDRFELAFDRMLPAELPQLREQYPYLFPQQYPDSVWIAKAADSLQREIRREVREHFRDFGPYRTELELFFKHAKYYFPQVREPHVITLTTDVDYQNRVVLADTLLLIGLDNYLGPDHPFYASLPRYVAAELDPDLLVSDVASAFGQQVIPPPRDRSFIARMVHYGKGLYLKDRLMPLAPDSVKIGYSASQWDWARANEGQIWRYFVERELLYSTDNKLDPRFLEPAPFSKFRLMLDNESPGRIGRYMGWQIVRSYMAGNDASLSELMALPEEELFRRSNYKPPK